MYHPIQESNLHWLVLVFFFALFVQWSIKPIVFKNVRRGGDRENTFLIIALTFFLRLLHTIYKMVFFSYVCFNHCHNVHRNISRMNMSRFNHGINPWQHHVTCRKLNTCYYTRYGNKQKWARNKSMETTKRLKREDTHTRTGKMGLKKHDQKCKHLMLLLFLLRFWLLVLPTRSMRAGSSSVTWFSPKSIHSGHQSCASSTRSGTPTSTRTAMSAYPFSTSQVQWGSNYRKIWLTAWPE